MERRIAELRAAAGKELDLLPLSDENREAFDVIDSYNANRTV
jgi:hypothetical protein